MAIVTIEVNTRARSQAVDITREVEDAVRGSGVRDGWVTVYVPHTTAGVTINEAADPDVMNDVLQTLDALIPWEGGYRHAEGNAAAHIKSVLTGSSVRVPLAGGRLVLGTWQGIFFMEFDGPRRRRVQVEAAGAGGAS